MRLRFFFILLLFIMSLKEALSYIIKHKSKIQNQFILYNSDRPVTKVKSIFTSTYISIALRGQASQKGLQ